ncbi:MAG: hypothetical protein ACTS41_00435 [Candidatus Hodgkinia cicadicola]
MTLTDRSIYTIQLPYEVLTWRTHPWSFTLALASSSELRTIIQVNSNYLTYGKP